MRIALVTILLIGPPTVLPAQDSTPQPVLPGRQADSTPPPLPRLGTTLVRPAAPDPQYEVDRVPVVDSVQAWYWPKAKMGRKADVVLQGIVDTTGRIEPQSIKLISASDTTFVPAAKLTFMVVYFRPGMAQGKPVRVLVQQSLAYGRVKGRWCEIKGPTPLLPPKCH